MPSNSPKLALMYGSCVSRDLVRIDSERFAPGHYTARQSWISATSSQAKPPVLRLKSPFQKRMVEDDFRSSARSILTSTRPAKSDVILLDLIDERVGVLKFDTSYVTYSNELKHSAALDLASDGPLIQFGSDEHFDLWSKSAIELRELLSPQLEKVRVIMASFAEKMDDGTPLEPFRGISASQWNHLYERYYELADQLGFQLIEQQKDLIISTPMHKWGATPFHYVDEAYLDLGSKILESL